jgi:hypothetical protein
MEDPLAEIVEMPQPLGIFAGELYDRGLEYWGAFRSLTDSDKTPYVYASYFLLAHSLELLLKSYLAARGVSKKELRAHQLRHDLAKIYDRSSELGIPDVSNLRVFCLSVHEMNRDYDFRYPSGYNLHVPSFRLCREIMEELLGKIDPMVASVRVRAQLDHIADTLHLKGKKIRWSD